MSHEQFAILLWGWMSVAMSTVWALYSNCCAILVWSWCMASELTAYCVRMLKYRDSPGFWNCLHRQASLTSEKYLSSSLYQLYNVWWKQQFILLHLLTCPPPPLAIVLWWMDVASQGQAEQAHPFQLVALSAVYPQLSGLYWFVCVIPRRLILPPWSYQGGWSYLLGHIHIVTLQSEGWGCGSHPPPTLLYTVHIATLQSPGCDSNMICQAGNKVINCTPLCILMSHLLQPGPGFVGLTDPLASPQLHLHFPEHYNVDLCCTCDQGLV